MFVAKGIDPCNDAAFGSVGLDNDGDGSRDSADTDCQAPVDNPPTVVISAPASGLVGDTLNFDGSGSTDDSVIISYDWRVDGVAAGSKMTLSWPFNIAGSFSVTLTVCDDTAQCNTASHGVNIRQQAAGGEALYMNNCASCHGNPKTNELPANASIKVAGVRVCSIQGAIYGTSQYPNGVETMRFMQGMLSDDQIQEIADYLNSFPVTGMQRYISACSGCHAQNADEDIRGSDAKDIKEAIHDEREMRFLDCLPDGDIDQIGLYLKAHDDDHGDDEDKDDDKDDGGDKDKKDDHKKHDGDKEHSKSHD